MALESFINEGKRLEEEELKKAGKDPQAEADEGPTTQEIVADPHMSGLLGEMLKMAGGKEELAKRMVDKKLEEADFKELAGYHDDFVEAMDGADKIRGHLTPEYAIELGKIVPEFKDILKNCPPENMVEAVSSQLDLMAIRDSKAFKKILKDVESVESFRNGEWKKLDEEVAELAKKEGLDAEEYAKALAIPDATKRREAVEKLIEKSWSKGGWKNIGREIRQIFTFPDAADRLTGKRADIDAAVIELGELKKKLGSALAASATGNADIREALARQILGGKKKEKAPPGMNEFKDRIPDDKEIKKNWEVAKKEQRNWNAMPEAERDVFRDHFANEYSAYTKKKLENIGGFWSFIFSAMFAGFMKNFDKKSLT